MSGREREVTESGLPSFRSSDRVFTAMRAIGGAGRFMEAASERRDGDGVKPSPLPRSGRWNEMPRASGLRSFPASTAERAFAKEIMLSPDSGRGHSYSFDPRHRAAHPLSVGESHGGRPVELTDAYGWERREVTESDLPSFRSSDRVFTAMRAIGGAGRFMEAASERGNGDGVKPSPLPRSGRWNEMPRSSGLRSFP